MHQTPIEDLLADAAWTRALAGALVRDVAAAENLVQETWRGARETASGRGAGAGVAHDGRPELRVEGVPGRER